jgi:hypothetical protein
MRADGLLLLYATIECMLCALPVNTSAEQNELAAPLRAEHRAVVQKWLTLNNELRLPTNGDITNKEALRRERETRGKTYYPFYAVGDFNRDGREDFAVILVSRRGRYRNTNPFAVAVFNGPFGRAGSSSRPAFFEAGFDSSDWLFFRPDDRLLLIGPPESDNCFILKPSGRKYIIRNCLP